MGYLDTALGVKGGKGGDLHDLIQEAIQKIDSTYQPGVVGWIKDQPLRWEQVLSIESRINKTALARDEAGLRKALGGYREFFKEMASAHQKTEEMPLLGGMKA